MDWKEADGVDRVAVGSQRGGRGQAKAHVTNVRRAHRAGHEQHVTARRERVGGLEAEIGSHEWGPGGGRRDRAGFFLYFSFDVFNPLLFLRSPLPFLL